MKHGDVVVFAGAPEFCSAGVNVLDSESELEFVVVLSTGGTFNTELSQRVIGGRNPHMPSWVVRSLQDEEHVIPAGVNIAHFIKGLRS